MKKVLAVSLLALAGCARAAAGPAAPSPEEAAEKKAPVDLARLMARESGPFAKHSLTLFDGLATGEYESTSPATPECQKDADEDVSCQLRLSLGEDTDGEPYDILCFVDTTPRGPFGAVVAHRIPEGAGLMEIPAMSVTHVGEGIAVELVANTAVTAEDGTRVGTTKVAMLYSQGYSATCSDVRAGGKKTFDRVAFDFFRSLKFKTNPRRPAHAAQGYAIRQGDRVTGFRYGLVEKRADGKPGFAEVHAYYNLETDGKTWQNHDGNLIVLRDPAGNIELYRFVASGHDGTQLGVLSAKPSEDGKFRLKFERQGGAEAIESTPKAPLSTELWSAGELAKVSKGARRSYRYATLALDDSGEPKFNYIDITRASPGVLLEEEQDKKAKKNLDGALKDELHVAVDGTVTKEVSSGTVSERIYTFGALPKGKEKGR